MLFSQLNFHPADVPQVSSAGEGRSNIYFLLWLKQLEGFHAAIPYSKLLSILPKKINPLQQ